MFIYTISTYDLNMYIFSISILTRIKYLYDTENKDLLLVYDNDGFFYSKKQYPLG